MCAGRRRGQSPELADGALAGLAGEAGLCADTGLAADTGDGAETGLATGDGADTGDGAETGLAGADWADTALIAVTAETALPGSTVAGSVATGAGDAGAGAAGAAGEGAEGAAADTADPVCVTDCSGAGAGPIESADAATAPPATATTPSVPVTIHAVRLFMMLSSTFPRSHNRTQIHLLTPITVPCTDEATRRPR